MSGNAPQVEMIAVIGAEGRRTMISGYVQWLLNTGSCVLFPAHVHSRIAFSGGL